MRLKLKKPTFSAALGQVVDVFSISNLIERDDSPSPIERTYAKRSRPSQQSFDESLRSAFVSVGSDLRWAINEHKKRTG